MELIFKPKNRANRRAEEKFDRSISSRKLSFMAKRIMMKSSMAIASRIERRAEVNRVKSAIRRDQKRLLKTT